MRARNDIEARGVGTGNNPASHGRARRCLSCGFWAPKEGGCRNCGKDPLALPSRLDEPTKRCSKCGLEQPLSFFVRDRQTTDGLNPWCRWCRTENSRQVRQAKRRARDAARGGIPGTWKRGQPGLSLALEERIWRLLTAAQAASSAGRWRGREGIRAYRDLRVAMDEWRIPETECVATGEDSPFAWEEA